MRKIALWLLLFAPLSVPVLQSKEAVQPAKHIDTEGLKALMDSHASFVLLDARGEKYHDESIIPGAKLAFYKDSKEKLTSMIPDKSTLVIVYCFSPACPLAGRLAKKLIDLGYTQVMEYPGGIEDWSKHYPVETL